jgi:excisionase family DNA binding protein
VDGLVQARDDWRTLSTVNPAPKLVSFSRFAATIGVSRHTIRRLVVDGKLRTVTIRRRRLIPISELRRLISEVDGAKAKSA